MRDWDRCNAAAPAVCSAIVLTLHSSGWAARAWTMQIKQHPSVATQTLLMTRYCWSTELVGRESRCTHHSHQPQSVADMRRAQRIAVVEHPPATPDAIMVEMIEGSWSQRRRMERGNVRSEQATTITRCWHLQYSCGSCALQPAAGSQHVGQSAIRIITRR